MRIDRHIILSRHGIQIHGDHDLGLIEDPRVSEGTPTVDRVPEIRTIPGDLSKILSPVSEGRLLTPHRRNAGDG